jgi:hypothetical protein
MSHPINTGGGGLKEELTGHATLAILALLGLALYTTTYSIVYFGSSSTPVVAVLEMWMVTVHLASPLACGLLQSLCFSSSPTKHIAQAQTSLFLGMACTITVAAVDCIQQKTNLGSIHCSAYYGAAAFPKFAAAGSIAWVWVMYASSLGCQFSSIITLGLSKKNSLTVASIILVVPYAMASKLGDTCGGTMWTTPLCNNACGVAGPIVVICMSFALSHAGGLLFALRQSTLGFILSLVGDLIMILGCFFLWLAQNGLNGTQHMICIVLGFFSFISSIRRLSSSSHSKKHNHPHTATTTTSATKHQSQQQHHHHHHNIFGSHKAILGGSSSSNHTKPTRSAFSYQKLV